MANRSEWKPGLKIQPPPSRPPMSLSDTPAASSRPLLVVLALNYTDFRSWCYGSGLSPEDRDVMYTDDPDRLRGISNAKVIRCPRWDQHHRAGDFDRQARRIEERSARP